LTWLGSRATILAKGESGMRIKRIIIISLVVALLIVVIPLLSTAGILVFCGVLLAFGGVGVVIRKKAYIANSSDDAPPDPNPAYVEGRTAVRFGSVMIIIGIVLIGVQIALWLR
jgi:hypothetical protein